MKQQVKISTYSFVLSTLVLLFILSLLYNRMQHGGGWPAGILLAAIMSLALAGLFYMPMAISADDRELCIHRPLRIKSIPLGDIKSIALCPTAASGRRICGSGGWWGYWGWFSEPDLGKYFAYYGRESDRFLVTLRDGRRYMLGCNNPQQIVDYVNHRITKPV